MISWRAIKCPSVIQSSRRLPGAPSHQCPLLASSHTTLTCTYTDTEIIHIIWNNFKTIGSFKIGEGDLLRKNTHTQKETREKRRGWRREPYNMTAAGGYSLKTPQWLTELINNWRSYSRHVLKHMTCDSSLLLPKWLLYLMSIKIKIDWAK